VIFKISESFSEGILWHGLQSSGKRGKSLLPSLIGAIKGDRGDVLDQLTSTRMPSIDSARSV